MLTDRTTFLIWAGEFACVTAIAVILGTTSAIFILIPVVGIIALKIFEYRRIGRWHYVKVRGQLEVVETLLPRIGGQYRCTYHVPVRRLWGMPRKLRQAFDYVPTGGGGGRTFDIQKGIIGLVYQRKGPRAEHFQNDEEYRDRMVQEYNYTVTEMGERRPDRRSYLAYPIVEGGTERVLGVFYFDSNVPNTFMMDDNNPAWVTIQTAIEAIRRGL